MQWQKVLSPYKYNIFKITIKSKFIIFHLNIKFCQNSNLKCLLKLCFCIFETLVDSAVRKAYEEPCIE